MYFIALKKTFILALNFAFLTLTFECDLGDLDKVEPNYIFRSDVISVQTSLSAHILLTECSTWTTKVLRNYSRQPILDGVPVAFSCVCLCASPLSRGKTARATIIKVSRVCSTRQAVGKL